MELNRNFNLLLTGQSLANIGDVLYIVSIIYLIFELTGSAAAAAFVPFTITSSMFVSNTLTPLLMQRFNLKWLLAFSQIGKTALLIELALFLPQLSLFNFYGLFIVISLVALLDGCASPVTQSFIPNYVNSAFHFVLPKKIHHFFDRFRVFKSSLLKKNRIFCIRIKINELLYFLCIQNINQILLPVFIPSHHEESRSN